MTFWDRAEKAKGERDQKRSGSLGPVADAQTRAPRQAIKNRWKGPLPSIASSTPTTHPTTHHVSFLLSSPLLFSPLLATCLQCQPPRRCNASRTRFLPTTLPWTTPPPCPSPKTTPRPLFSTWIRLALQCSLPPTPLPPMILPLPTRLVDPTSLPPPAVAYLCPLGETYEKSLSLPTVYRPSRPPGPKYTLRLSNI